MKLYLVRHARPVVAEGTCYGSTDIPADEGHEQRILPGLASRLPVGIPIVSSPLCRCRSLAVALAHALRAQPPVFEPRLAEMDFGAWEMRQWDDIPRQQVDAWATDLVHYRPGGGERLLDVARRVQHVYQELCARHEPAALVVAHAGTIRLLLAASQCASAEGMVVHAASAPHRIAHGDLVMVDCQTNNETAA